MARFDIIPVTLERILSSVVRDEKTNCWNWTGAKLAFGYGAVNTLGKVKTTHRLMWEIIHGEPPSTFICHRCDNPSCVNPMHLFAGTHRDNNEDMVLKGRVKHGDTHSKAKLTSEKAKAIAIDQRPFSAIARYYGVHRITIRQIKRGQTWWRVSGIPRNHYAKAH